MSNAQQDSGRRLAHPGWTRLPGTPVPYVVRDGEGETVINGGALAHVILSKDETNGEFGIIVTDTPRSEPAPGHVHERAHHTFLIVSGQMRVWADDQQGHKMSALLGPGDFAFIPAGSLHTFQVESESAKAIGVNSAGFERFFQAWGMPTDAKGLPVEPYAASYDSLVEAAKQYGTVFRPDWDYRTAEEK